MNAHPQKLARRTVRPSSFTRALLLALVTTLFGILPAATTQAAPVSNTTSPLTVWDLGQQYSHYTWNAVNDSGEVAGYYTDYANSIKGIPELLASSWLNGTIKTYGKTAAVGNAIDDAGTIFGASADPNSSNFIKYATRWPSSGKEIVDSNTGINADSMNGGYRVSTPAGVVGGMEGSGDCSQCAFVAKPPDYTPKVIPGGATVVNGVNNLGHAVVTAGTAYNFYNGKTLVKLPLETWWSANILNDNDVVAGGVAQPSGQNPPVLPATWRDGKTTILPTLRGTPTGNYDMANAINDNGFVVGQSTRDQALLWQNGKVVTLDSLLPKNSTWDLTTAKDITNTGYILGTGTLGGTAEYYLAKLPGTTTISGTVYDENCGEDTCSRAGIPGVTVLVNGKDSDGAAFTKTNVTAADGTWSIKVPNGTYDAGPTLDSKTFAGPAFDPSEKDAIKVDGKSVTNVNFSVCALPSGNIGSTASRSAVTKTIRPDHAGYTEALCKTQYTIKLSAHIPGSQIVDPSLAAPFNSSTDPNNPAFPAETSKLGSLFYSRVLDSVFEEYPKYPACPGIYGKTQEDQSKTLEEYAKDRVRMSWYSYMSGGNLGSVTAPMVFNQRMGDHGTASFNGEPSQTSGQLTRTWVYKYIKNGPDTKTHSCSVTTPVSALALLTPGGNDRRGLVNENSFTLVVLWYIPFSPAGAVVPPGTTAEKVIKGILGEQEGEHIIDTYEHMSWIYRFAFTATLGSAGVKALEGAATLSKGLKASAAVIARWKTAAEIAEKLHTFHSAVDVSKAAGEEIVNLLSGEHYPIMGEVIRGTFDVKPNVEDKNTLGLIGSQTLGMSIAGSSFPDITMTVERQAKDDNGLASCRVTNGILPWNTSVVGCPYVYNPFSSNPTNMLAQAPTNLSRGTNAVDEILKRTHDLEPLEDQDIKYTGDVYEKLGDIQSLINPPECLPSRGPSSQQSRTICYTFEDGRP